ncbi:hypothetical protein GQ43DRAFT_430486 [Delitschia confertaspora ATCC 74209]|uniref:Uncharacterized protein n=1 Tax=Delitschia confertaspora ATCC 74209 TaxID=1513339 RepID=A0A9P4JPD8_9PLEO|nr:hypothetical protein GQ43DRAFT_430486 [Delitschia confertaspora ATCC 74209]
MPTISFHRTLDRTLLGSLLDGDCRLKMQIRGDTRIVTIQDVSLPILRMFCLNVDQYLEKMTQIPGAGDDILTIPTNYNGWVFRQTYDSTKPFRIVFIWIRKAVKARSNSIRMYVTGTLRDLCGLYVAIQILGMPEESNQLARIVQEKLPTEALTLQDAQAMWTAFHNSPHKHLIQEFLPRLVRAGIQASRGPRAKDPDITTALHGLHEFFQHDPQLESMAKTISFDYHVRKVESVPGIIWKKNRIQAWVQENTARFGAGQYMEYSMPPVVWKKYEEVVAENNAAVEIHELSRKMMELSGC